MPRAPGAGLPGIRSWVNQKELKRRTGAILSRMNLFYVGLHEPFGHQRRLVPRALWLPGRIAGLAFFETPHMSSIVLDRRGVTQAQIRGAAAAPARRNPDCKQDLNWIEHQALPFRTLRTHCVEHCRVLIFFGARQQRCFLVACLKLRASLGAFIQLKAL
jgi:hypothetical protein